MLKRDVCSIAEGALSATPQSDEGVSYAHKILSEEARIDWIRPAAEIERTVRAFDPAPGAFTFLGGKRLKIYRGLLLGKTNGRPGEILSADRSGLMVSCGDSQGLLLQDLQLEGRRRQNSHEFINGLSVSNGTILGDV